LHPVDEKRYMHHYNFPGFSVGETRPSRSPGRREIGHGALAERALVPVLPKEEEFPYVVRVVSEVLSSNGSTSMGSVCGSTLSLMDAGVPIKAPVSGVAMGLIKEGDEVRILTDIQGIEDFLGDMDFKVAGTRAGITALQMDMKITGITVDVVEQAIRQAKAGREFILDKMLETIAAPRPQLAKTAPRLLTFKVDPEDIGKIIGPGGKTVRGITEATGAKVDISDDGTITVSSSVGRPGGGGAGDDRKSGAAGGRGAGVFGQGDPHHPHRRFCGVFARQRGHDPHFATGGVPRRQGGRRGGCGG